MAQQSEASIPRVGKRKWGYDPDQVDEFLEHAHALYDGDGVQLTQRDIQNASFDLTRGGYVIAQVDATLARLERAVVDKQTAREISQHGRVTWKAQTEDLYHEVARHVGRATGERFSSGKPHVPSYDRKQVDKLADRIVDKCAAELGIDGISKEDVKGFDKITAEAVANSVFTQRKGKKGYDERQVDYFLNSCVQLLSRIESYGRISDRIAPNAGESSEVPAVAAVAPAVSAVASDESAPLISEDAQFQSAVSESLAASEPEPVQAPDKFTAVSQAEQSLFAQPEQPGSEGAAQSAQPASYAPSLFPQGSTANEASNETIPPSFAPPTVTAEPQTPSVESQQHEAAPQAPAVTPLFAAVPSVETPAEPVAHTQPASEQTSPFAPAAAAQPAEAKEKPSIFAQSAFSQPLSTPETAATASFAAPSYSAPSVSSAADSRFAPPQQAPQSAPITPAASSAPVSSFTQRASESNASLASLAHMAEVSQEMPKVEEKSFVPKVPSLDAPSPFASTAFPSFAPAAETNAPHSVPQNGGNGDEHEENNGNNGDSDSSVKFDFTFPGADIPDLSFPTFDNEKKEQ